MLVTFQFWTLSVSAADFFFGNDSIFMLVFSFFFMELALNSDMAAGYLTPAMLIAYKYLIYDGTPCCCNISLIGIP